MKNTEPGNVSEVKEGQSRGRVGLELHLKQMCHKINRKKMKQDSTQICTFMNRSQV